MTFLKIIFAFVLFYYLFVIVIRYVLPFLLRRQFRKAQENFYGQAGQKKEKSRKGGVDFEYPKNDKTKKMDDDLGEYVDYEEIKD